MGISVILAYETGNPVPHALLEEIFRDGCVIDFENLQEDIHSLPGFWKNKVTRILLVVVFTNLGSSIGTFVAIPLMVKVL